MKMQTAIRIGLLTTAVAGFCSLNPQSLAQGVTTIAYDTFDLPTPGTATRGDDAGDPLDLPWYQGNNAPGRPILTVSNDAVFGSGNALFVDTSSFSQPAFATFYSTPIDLGRVGNWVTLTLDFRLTDLAGVTNATAFRFGFFDSGGGQTPSDQSTQFRNHPGYLAIFGVNSAFRQLFRDNATDASPLGGPDITGLATSGDAVSISNTTAHTLMLSMIRTSSGISLTAKVDNLTFTATDSSLNPFIRFDEIGFSHNVTSGNLDYSLDNVQIQFVPEPTCLLLVGLGAIFLLRRR